MTKKKWDAELNRGWRKKIYLEGECFAWLKKCLEYGTEARARKRAEPPVVTIRSKTQADGMEILLCQAHGFYPREIDASWRRDGEVWLEDTLQESVAPNSDGTYHYQLSVRIDPKERGRYRCHVEHDGLQEPLDVAMEEAEIPNEENLIFILYSTIPVLGILILGITGILCYKKCRRRDYRAAAKSDPSSSMDNAERSPLKETEGIPPLNNTAGEESKGDCPPSQGIGEKKQPPENHQISV